jgi:hypothetical protein
MNCPMNVGVVVFIKVFYGVDYLARFLRSRSVVKVD